MKDIIRAVAVMLISVGLWEGAGAQFNVSGPGFLPDVNGTNPDEPQAKKVGRIAVQASASQPDAFGEVTLTIRTNTDTSSLKLNGDELGGKADGVYTAKRVARAGQETKFTVVARDLYGNTDTKVLTVSRPLSEAKESFAQLNAANLRPQRGRDAVAIIIGIQDYQRIPRSEFSNDDARSFYEYAVRGLGIDQGNIKLLVDSEANAVEITRAFKSWLPSRVNREKTDVYVFYSGHGLPSADGKSLYFLPYGVDSDLLERTAIAQREVVNLLQDARPKSVTMFIDSCYAGQTRGGEQLLRSARPLKLQVQVQENPYPDNFVVMAASDSSQISSSSPDLKHGVFSYYLMKGMEGNADENKDGTITFAEMHSYLTKSVVRFAMTMNRIQEPQLFGDGSRVLIGNVGLASVDQQSVAGGAVIKDCAECPEMVVIPAGSFLMGSEKNADEQPPHTVAIRSFLMGKVEVTQRQWMDIMGRNPSHFLACGLNCPVENVSWDDAQQFVAKLNQKTGQRYRLPSEAEWEYAARAGTTAERSFGDDESKLGNYAWYVGNSGRQTHEVAQKRPNAFGLFDMHGNVWEWTDDCWHESYAGAPINGSGWNTACNGANRVLRGGSWLSDRAISRSAFRFRDKPDSRYFTEGFRLARDLFNAEAANIAEQDNKQAEDPRPSKDEKAAEAAARKQKDKEVAARIERVRQQKEQEDRIKKMAKELENKELTEGVKKRILKDAYVDITALDTAFNLVAKVSDKYAASIQAAIRPNITFDPDFIAGNPAVEIQVGLTADGTITNATIVMASGISSWDAAAIRAVRKTERLPKDESGRAPSTLLLVLRPRER